MNIGFSYRALVLCYLVLFNSCLEEIDFETDNFESLLVVDATITNELKTQEITLSRTFEFGEDNDNIESGAQVKVVGDGVEYIFQHTETGKYQSIQPFNAQPNVVYHLEITTADGERYSSSEMKLTTATQIDNLYAERITNDDGVDGVAIKVDSFDPTNTANFYRYTFEETYKIVAPMWRQEDLYLDTYILDSIPVCVVKIRQRPEEQKACYKTEFSNKIKITLTSGLNEDLVEGYLVNFLPSDDFKISHRYSALVKQFVISEEAFNYLETIQSFTSQGSLFSQVQTGFVMGNISSTVNPNKKVIGIFDVSSVTTQRLFFNFIDFYPNTNLPPFITSCDLRAPDVAQLFQDGDEEIFICSSQLNFITNRIRVYLEEYTGDPPFYVGPADPPLGPWLMVPRACGDCTALGEPEPPSFWVE
ncbi:hypothetical protein ULMS_22970 [Patiriisocius marinistellae]|uniref:DUF4249 domain-containing protein n=2 Tax=Patiriisocius marinistellae TaxID=2494560 RepID=A0A5J4G237_9FLAO|nr:hypothetical protein ULMS_22970 [Patiriisocius marinistellae]